LILRHSKKIIGLFSDFRSFEVIGAEARVVEFGVFTVTLTSCAVFSLILCKVDISLVIEALKRCLNELMMLRS
jgi:hypothetical protein